MLFQDESCTADNTLQTYMTNGIFEMLKLDFGAIISVGYTGKYRIDAYKNPGELNFRLCCDFIEAYKSRLLAEQETYRQYAFQDHYFVRYLIRKAKSYEVFYIFGKKSEPVDARDLQWFSYYVAKAYNNILLNNELIQNNDYIANVFDSTESSILVFDLKLNIVSYNRKAESLFPDAPPQNPVLKDLPFENQGLVKEYIETVIQKKEKRRLSDINLRQETSNRIFTITFSPLHNSKGLVSGVVAVASDITQIRLMQFEVEQLGRYGLLGEIALGISHDVKNPLMNIKSCANYLQRHPLPRREADNYLAMIIQESDRINSIVDELMSFGNISRENSVQYLNLNDILYNCKQIAERQKLYRQVDIRAVFDEKLPLFQAKNSDMQQVFLNIMLNGLQAIDEFGTISVESLYDTAREQISITIADTGKGIQAKDFGKLFTPYYTTKTGGRGLGLFLVKRTLNRYQGSLDIQSQPGKGTVCTISLPYQSDLNVRLADG